MQHLISGAPVNATAMLPDAFTLLGIPGLESLHRWLSIPFCSMYLVALLGNVGLLLVIKVEPSLHEPMYLFLGMLSLTDLVLSSSTLPKLLAILWFGRKGIGFHACLAQMFFIHSFTAMESGFFLAMAYDRYMAICNPLRHAAVLTNALLAKVGLAVVARGLVLFLPHPFLVGRLPFCKPKVIVHSYCEFMALLKLACADTAASGGYSLTLAFLIGAFDVCFISLSYGLILRTVCRLPSKENQPQGPGHLQLAHLRHTHLLHDGLLLLPHPPLWPQRPSLRPHPHRQRLPRSSTYAEPHHLRPTEQEDPGEGAEILLLVTSPGLAKHSGSHGRKAPLPREDLHALQPPVEGEEGAVAA